MKEKTEFIYTLSSKEGMVKDACYSIISLSRFVDKNKIRVVFTPPIQESDVDKLKQLGVNIERKEHYVDEMFRMDEYDELRSYADKLWITESEKENVVFIDCDTLIMKNIWSVLEGDFEFKARPGSAEKKNWRELFKENNEPYLDWMPNAGFLVFKNNKHREISEKWREYYLDLDDNSYTKGSKHHREQYALSLAVSNLEIVKMNSSEHLMEWQDDLDTEAILYHKSNESTTYKQELRRFIRHTQNLDKIKAVKAILDF